MINFLFGCSGSGKTRYIFDKLRDAAEHGRHTYLIVPEQQVFTAETMLSELPPKSALYIEVVSFSRLCELVFDRFGGRFCTSVSGGIRGLVMWQSIRELSPALADYGSCAKGRGLAEKMLQTYDELRANSISTDEIAQAAQDAASPDLKNKLYDISLILSAYTANLEKALGEGALFEENKLERMCTLLSENNFFGGSDVYMDSFTDFTGIQHKIIAQIMKQADNMCISLCVSHRGAHAPHTASITEAAKMLTRSARESGNQFEDIPLSGNTRTQSHMLRQLEQLLWNFSADRSSLPKIPPESSSDIEAVLCKNEYCETECAALKILDAHRRGIKYSEMAVILRSPEERAGMIEAVFSKYNIPYFISEKKQLTVTPIARFILSSLRCISHNYRRRDVLTLLKSGMCDVSDLDADLFEDYCLTWNINGNTFRAPTWNMNPSGYVTATDPRTQDILVSANKVRQALIEPLEELRVRLRAAQGNATELCRALYSYMEQLHISERLSSLAEIELELGNLKDASELLRTYDYVLSSLSAICTVLGDSIITADELSDAIEIMLTNTDLGSVPQVSDYVVVGSAATLRAENIRLAVVMELCEGVFPSTPTDVGLLCDSDKDSLEDLGIMFKARTGRLMSDELFYVYRAMTKPSEKLIITTYSATVSGNARTPSTPWRRILSLFDIPVEEFDSARISELAATLRDANSPDSGTNGSDGNTASNTASNTAASPEPDHNTADIPVISPARETCSPDIARIVFGDSLYLSKSRIQSFAKCPMLFWSKSALLLRPRTEAAVSTSESGTLIHYALENILRETALLDGSLPRLDRAQILALSNKWVDRYINSLGCERSPALMYSFSGLRNMTYLMTQNIFEEFSKSDFKIFALEQNISAHGANALKPLEIKLDEISFHPTVYLGGSADRIDTFRSADTTYVRIIDYKTGNVAFNEERVTNGADIQLPAYLFSVCSEQNKNALTGGTGDMTAAGAQYVSAVESKGDISISRSGMIYNCDEVIYASNHDRDLSFISTAASKQADSKRNTNTECPELMSAEQMQHMRELLTETVKTTGTQIYTGIIERTPSSDSCRFCPIRNSCAVACKSKY